MVKVGVINVTGYAGAELARLLYLHPQAQLTSVTGRSAAGKSLSTVFPHLACYGLTVTESLADDVEFVFSALPHAASAEAIAPLARSGVPVVDISADFRLRDATEYGHWYKIQHPAPDLLPQAVYGLSELNREGVAASRLVANPGCYSTAALLALAPAAKAGIVGPDIIIDAKSGVSGAGRGIGLAYHFPEANESVAAYSLGGHRHLPEIVQELAGWWPAENGQEPVQPKVTFIPHLIPMTRGIFSTAYASLLPGALPGGEAGLLALREIYCHFYRGEPFVRVVDSPPATKQTWGNNLCLIYPTLDTRTGRLVVLSVIDNLVKGAAGQAIQNMNLMLGFPETVGLDMPAVYP